MEYQTYGDQVKSIKCSASSGDQQVETRNGDSFYIPVGTVSRIDGPWEHQHSCTLQDVYYHFGRFQTIGCYICTGCDNTRQVPFSRNCFSRGQGGRDYNGAKHYLLTGYRICLTASGYDLIPWNVYPTFLNKKGVQPFGYRDRDLWMDFKRVIYSEEYQDMPRKFHLNPVKCLHIFPGITITVNRGGAWDGRVYGSELFDIVFGLRTPTWVSSVQED